MKNYLLIVLMLSAYWCKGQDIGALKINGNSYFEVCAANFINRSDDAPNKDKYKNDEDYHITICPENHNGAKNVTVTFTRFDLDDGYDFLEVYDDNRTQAVPDKDGVPYDRQIGRYTGKNIPTKISSTRGCLTFRFTSDGRIAKSGWRAIVSCESTNNPNPYCEAREIECGKTYTDNTKYGINNRTGYNCESGTWVGKELVYKITTTQRGDIKATLRTNSSLDLDIFILKDCSTDCVARNVNGAGNATSIVRYDDAPAGDYYIVIDGQFINTNGAFDLIVDCEPTVEDCYNDYIIQDMIADMCRIDCNVSLYKADYYGMPVFYKEVYCPYISDSDSKEVLDCNGNIIAIDRIWSQNPINHNQLNIKELIYECNNVDDCLVSDNFEYFFAGGNVNSNISEVNPSIWKKWANNVPDGKISAEHHFSYNPSLEINRNQYGVQDVILKLGNRNNGIYKVSWKMYINDSDAAYFNVQNSTDILESGGDYGLRFRNTSTSYQNRWFEVALYFDLDRNRMKVIVDNGRYESERNYSANLGGINFYAIEDAHFYIDDICMEAVSAIPFTRKDDSASSRSRDNQTEAPLVVDASIKKSTIVKSNQEVLTVYPNPTKGITNVSLELAQEETINVSIFNQTGQMIKQIALGQKTHINQSIDLSDLPNGLYILKAHGTTTNLSQKVLVQR